MSPTEKGNAKDQPICFNRCYQAQSQLCIDGSRNKHDAYLCMRVGYRKDANQCHNGTAGTLTTPETTRRHLRL